MGKVSSPSGLSRRSAVHAILSFKAGKPPKYNVQYFTVGAMPVDRKIENVYLGALSYTPRFGLIVGDYGEGKSHMLNLCEDVARRKNFVHAYVVHNRTQDLGLHKPRNLLSRILKLIERDYPEIDRDKLHSRFYGFTKMTNGPEGRWLFARALSELSFFLLDEGYNGLAICIDEIEDCMNLHFNQFRPVYETMNYLLSELDGPIAFFFATTTAGFETLLAKWRLYVAEQDVIHYEPSEIYERLFANRIEMMPWSAGTGTDFCEKLIAAHSVAFDWEPPLSGSDLYEIAAERASRAPSARWRAFVQNAVTALEVIHQQTYSYSGAKERERAGGSGRKQLQAAAISIASEGATPGSTRHGAPVNSDGLAPGVMVRVVSGPHKGKLAEVVGVNAKGVIVKLIDKPQAGLSFKPDKVKGQEQ